MGPDEERRRLIRRVMRKLENRIKIFVSLPIDSLDKLTLQARLDEFSRAWRKAPAPR